MSDLVAFMRARLDEDEAAASPALTTDRWRADDGCIYADGEILHREGDPHTPSEAIGEHVARWDPARVLAEVAAKRAILDRYESYLDQAARLRRTGERDLATSGALLAMLGAVKLLAQPHAEHPDFDPAWRTT